MLMVNEGLWDKVALEDIKKRIHGLQKSLKDKFPELEEKVMTNHKLNDEEIKRILQFVKIDILKIEEDMKDANVGSDSKED